MAAALISIYVDEDSNQVALIVFVRVSQSHAVCLQIFLLIFPIVDVSNVKFVTGSLSAPPSPFRSEK